MQMTATLKMKEIYQEVREKLFKMIPEKWESIYLYSSVLRGVGGIETAEMFFYYFPKGILKKKPVNVYEVPARFNLEEDMYMQLVDALYGSIKELREEFKKQRKPMWDSMTIKIEKMRFIVEFHYDGNTQYNHQEKHLVWQYKNLKVPLESFNKKDRNMILRYLEEEHLRNSKTVTYEEALYQKNIHNTIEYGKTMENKRIDKVMIENEIEQPTCQEQEKEGQEAYTIKKKSQILNF